MAFPTFSNARLIALAAMALCALGCTQGAHYGVRSSLGSGAAFTPSGYSKATTSTVGYYEQGGVVSKAILSMLAAMSAAPRTRTTSTTTTRTTDYGSHKVIETRTRTTTTVLDSPEEIAAKAARAQAMLNAIESSAIPFEFSLDFATPSLVGNTDGYMWSFMYSSEPEVSGNAAFRFLLGIAGGEFRYSGLERTRLIASGNQLVPAVLADQNYTYDYFGFPVRFEAGFRSGLRTYLQADLNLYSIDFISEDDEASPFRFGLGRDFGPLKLSGELVVDSLRTDGMTAQLGVALVL